MTKNRNNPEIDPSKLMAFFENMSAPLQNVGKSLTQVFESVCFFYVAKYYESRGCKLSPKNLINGYFKLKHSTNGYPWNFSYISILELSSGEEYELHHNLKVVGRYVPEGVGEKQYPLFAADIAIIRALTEVEIEEKKEKGIQWVANDQLVTFGEAKKLVAYPMLIAHFVGIIHELAPTYMGDGSYTSSFVHIPPTLFTTGKVTSGTMNAFRSLRERGVCLVLCEGVDTMSEAELMARFVDWRERHTTLPEGN